MESREFRINSKLIKRVPNGNFVRVQNIAEIPAKKSNIEKKFKAYGAEIIPGHGIMDSLRVSQRIKSWVMHPYDEDSVVADNKGHRYPDIISTAQTRSYSNKEHVNQLYQNEVKKYHNRIMRRVVN